jgi:RHS repeat-associated protein
VKSGENPSLDVELTYDEGTNQKGRLTTMTDGSGTTSLSYDAFGNLVEEEKVIGGQTHNTAYTFDEADLLESITYPSGRTVEYTRNVLGQVETVETTYAAAPLTVADEIEYLPFGPLSGLEFGNSLGLARTLPGGSYDWLALAVEGSAMTSYLQWRYVGSGADWTVTTPSTEQEYEFRFFLNNGYTLHLASPTVTVTSNPGSGPSIPYGGGSNRIATHGGQTVTLDDAGNTTADPEEDLSFTYDDHNRMVEAYVDSVLQASYVYNGHGQRVKKIEATGAERTIVYHYGLSGELLGETIYSDAGAKIGERDYLWLDSLPIAQSEREFSGSTITDQQFVYLHGDQLNTPRLATDPTGEVVWRWDSDAFGIGEADVDPDSDTEEVNVRLRFPGQYWDEETGLHYNYFRDYDPVVGRYPQSDPIGLLGGINTYSYALNYPIGLYDPYGLWVPPSLPQWAVDSTAGFGDVLSFGVTDWVRDQMGTNAVFDKCSSAYSAGEWGGVGLGLAMGGAGLVRGGLRFEIGSWKQGGQWFFREGTRGPHFHYGVGPGLQSHHLPWQIGNWARNLWSLTRRGQAGEDLANLAAVGYGSAAAASGAMSTEGCGCE